MVTKLSQSHGYTPTQKELEEMLRKSFSWRERDERARASCERRWLQAAEEAKAAGEKEDVPSQTTPSLFGGDWVTAGPTKRKQGRQVRDLDRTRERELLFVDALAQELNASRVDDDDEASLALARRLQSTRDQERREREANVGGSWVCTACTFENPNPNALACDICNMVRLDAAEDAAALESARAAAVPRPSAPVPPPAPPPAPRPPPRPAPAVAAPSPAPAATQAARPEPPDALVCPISMELMRDPVMAMDGHTYERGPIERWLADHQTSPKTNEPLPSTTLVPNHAVKSMVQEYLEAANG